MSLRHKLVYYMRVAARYIEQPSTLALRRYYFMPRMFEALSQPWLTALKIATILDIGANVGDFAFTARHALPNAQIYSFEPLPDCYSAMLQHLKRARKFTAFNTALGEETGEMPFIRSSHSPSSSFLKMAEPHKQAFPSSATSVSSIVKIERLDTVVRQLEVTDPILIKIDVQGYEDHVLRGGEQTIKRAKVLIVETCYVRLYEKQPLFGDIFELLTEWGFTYNGSIDRLPDPRDQKPIQEDSLFIKTT